MAHYQRQYREIVEDVEREREHEQEEFRLASSEMAHDGKIPRKFTNQGVGTRRDESPPLEWYGIPHGTESLVLIVEDPDAPDPDHPLVPWTHWYVYVCGFPPILKALCFFSIIEENT